MKKIIVSLGSRSYPIFIDQSPDFSRLAVEICRRNLGTDAFVISNPQVYALFGRKLQQALEDHQLKSCFHLVADSETSKSLKAYAKAVAALSRIDTKKQLFIIALGGGVVGDLSGFVAATYKRGIPYVQVPTTLLAQVDSAIGGKTAIDLPSGKNLVGAFYQPKMIYSNISALSRLPKRQIISGLAEVVKYGVISDNKLFRFLEQAAKKASGLSEKDLAHIVYTASKIKAKVVEIDEHETLGLRTILNFGHTIGHALETASKYQNLNHGEAVSIGMVCAAEIAGEMGLFSPKDNSRLISLLELLKLPTTSPKTDLNTVFRAFYRDKKFIHGRIRMVLPTRIGHVIVTEDVPLKLIQQVLKKRIA